ELFKLPNDKIKSGWIAVEASSDQLQGFFSFDEKETFQALKHASKEFVLSTVSQDVGVLTGLVFVNPGPDPAAINVRLSNIRLGLISETGFILPANGHTVRLVDSLLDDKISREKQGELASHIEIKSDNVIVIFPSSFQSLNKTGARDSILAS